MIVLWPQCFIATLLTGLRLYTWAKVSHYAGRAMVIALIAWVSNRFWLHFMESFQSNEIKALAFISQILMTVSKGLGLGSHATDSIPYGRAKLSLELDWICTFFSLIAIGTAKASICVLLITLQGPLYKGSRLFLFGLLISNVRRFPQPVIN